MTILTILMVMNHITEVPASSHWPPTKGAGMTEASEQARPHC